METKLRIWRVVPTSKTGSQAPYFFIETSELVREKAFKAAQKQAESLTGLSRFNTWNLVIEKAYYRKDRFGRYVKYHQ